MPSCMPRRAALPHQRIQVLYRGARLRTREYNGRAESPAGENKVHEAEYKAEDNELVDLAEPYSYGGAEDCEERDYGAKELA